MFNKCASEKFKKKFDILVFRAMPHIKTYTKISPDGGSLAYVMLTR
jgi:hypothetical protein